MPPSDRRFPQDKPTTILVVDDDRSVLHFVDTAVREIGLESRCFLAASEFLVECRRTAPACLVVDLCLASDNGISVFQQAREQGCPAPGILISSCVRVADAVCAMQLGMATVLEKPLAVGQLQHELRCAVEHGGRIRAARRARFEVLERLESLTSSERAVFELLVAGHSNKAVAHQLDIGLRTVEARRRTLLTKMKCSTLPDLVRASLKIPEAA